MDLLFRLSKTVEGFEDIDNTKYFFSDILASRDENHFFDVVKREDNLISGDQIYFVYDSYIVAKATFSGIIIVDRERDDKYIYGHQLIDLSIIDSQERLNHKLFGPRTRYLKTEEMKHEISKIIQNEGTIYPDEINSSTLTEGAKTQVTVNAYERNPRARKECLKKHGYKCKVCSFDFENIYGNMGKNFIHVHHLKPLSEIQEEYEVDAENDLRPVCPNCHAMLHRKKPAYSISELKAIIAKN